MRELSVLDRNLAVLPEELRRRVRRLEPGPLLSSSPSRAGPPVPFLLREGRAVPLHSAFDPVKEAERLARSTPLRGFYACLGIGAGYHLREILSSPSVSGIIAIDFSIELFSRTLAAFDLSDLLADPRLAVLIDPTGDQIEELFIERYLPFLSGAFTALPLRSRVDLDRPLFESASETLSRLLSRASDDYTVQSKFGKLWFRNALRNLERCQELDREERPALPAIDRALVCAAGPSLEAQLPAIAEGKRKGGFLIATDTSLPFLLGRGLEPDAAVSIDCQLISYSHFMGGYPRGVPLVMDLAGPPAIARLASPLIFFSSGHPFCRYASTRWRPFPALDSSGGNVTHASISLAQALGASSIRLFGADFSYPGGKCYARGTYLYPYFEIRSSRLHPVEAHFSDFLFRNPRLEREASGASFRYLTRLLLSYRERLESYVGGLGLEFSPEPGEGLPLKRFAAPPFPPARSARSFRLPEKTSTSLELFLSSYRAGIEALETPRERPLDGIRALPPSRRDLWTTMLPQAAAFSRTREFEGADPGALLEKTKAWTVETIGEILGA